MIIFNFQVIRPRNMIFMSIVTCIAAAIALVAVGGEAKYGLYVGTGKSLQSAQKIHFNLKHL